MVLFSSSGALLSFVVLRRINPQYALVYGAASMLASVLGVLVLGGMIKRTGRSSLVVFALALVMGTGLVCITGFGIQTLEEAWTSRSQGLGFHDLCA
ncbi:uncharacterized protein HaLaN_19235 [Haematococcus lacustris]|uniref:Uncharacterized protein n=1 Tax=Haematococcus lacustris TaxID=44745 RepID=A0A699ZLB3_HAELA|nr:uncharacterized protein HaLaN_19235 [Haematococcus lacustris]